MNRLLLQRKSEIEVIRTLDSKYPEITAVFEKNLPIAKKRVLHQLIQAVIREGIFPVSYSGEREGKHAEIFPSSDSRFTIPISHEYILGHIEISGNVLYRRGSNVRSIDHPADFALLLNLQEKDSTFIDELENSVVNYALALAGAEYRKRNLRWQKDAFSFLVAEKKKNRCFSPLVFGEQWVIEGHTLHPCTKTKLGLSACEVIKYSPEWEGQANLIPVAIHKNLVFMNSLREETMTRLLLEEYPLLAAEFKEQLPAGGKDYELVPVHPWQLEHTIEPYLQKEINQAHVIPLEKVHIPASALLSFRSLAPSGSRTRHHIKTAVDVQMTSAKRTVSPASVKNGPAVSAILEKIEAIEPAIRNSYHFLAESAGGHYLPREIEASAFLMKNLSALLRENPEKNLEEGEIALPAAFLISSSPFSGKLILLELVESHSRTKRIPLREAAVQYMRTYAELLLPGLMTLIVKYGISLEAHLQNTVPVFRHGMPVRILFRDNGGIRIKEERFKRFEWGCAIDNATNLLTDKDQDLFDMFSHALLHNHLGEMIFALSKDLQVKEEVLWQPVKDAVSSSIASLKKQESCKEAAALLEKQISAPFAPLKAMVKMRLAGQVTENVYTSVRNPLRKTSEEGVRDGS